MTINKTTDENIYAAEGFLVKSDNVKGQALTPKTLRTSMKHLLAIISVVCFAFSAGTGFAAPYNVSEEPPFTEQRKSVTVTTNDVVIIKAASGAVAVVQFTNLGSDDKHTASYRWRYFPSKSQPVNTGKGQVRESYERKRKDDGSYIITPKVDHDSTVRAGGLRIDWSYGSDSQVYLYYVPSRASIQILPPDAFDKDL